MTLSIPRIFHVVWLGTAPLPDHVLSWIRVNPSWDLQLWKRADLFQLDNSREFDQARTYSEKSDVWRFELLRRFGGVYIDADFVAIRPIDRFLEGIDCFAATQDGELISTGIIGCTKGHPTIAAAVKAMPIDFPRSQNPDENSGPRWFTKLISSLPNPMAIRVFPREIFYPLFYGERDAVPADPINSFPDACAMHLWMHSWHGVRQPQELKSWMQCKQTDCVAEQSHVEAELASFANSWQGGFFNDIDSNRELQQVVKHCIRGRLADKTVLEIGPGRGAWTSKMLLEHPNHIHCLDALSAEHNGFWEYLGETARPCVTYHHIRDFSCSMLEDDSIDFLFSYDAICHISLTGVTLYFRQLWNKLRGGAEGFVMLADASKYVRESGWNGWVKYGDGVAPDSYNGEAWPERWYWIGVNRFCDLLESLGYEVLERDIDVTSRDPICHFRRPWQCDVVNQVVDVAHRDSTFSSRITMLTMAVGKQSEAMADLVGPRKQAYCEERGYRFVDRRSLPDPSRHPFWNKLLVTREELQRSDWVVWSDADTILWNEGVRLESFIRNSNGKHFLVQHNHEGINAGVFLIQNCDWSFQFLDHLLARTDLDDHPWKDQQAIIEAEVDPQWGDAYLVYPRLQPFQGFHGYWCFEEWDKLLIHFAGIEGTQRLRLMHNVSRLASLYWEDRLTSSSHLAAFVTRFYEAGTGVCLTGEETEYRSTLLSEWPGNLHVAPYESSPPRDSESIDFIFCEPPSSPEQLQECLKKWAISLRPGGLVIGAPSDEDMLHVDQGDCVVSLAAVQRALRVSPAVTADERNPLWYGLASTTCGVKNQCGDA